MKKWLCVLLAGALLCGITACKDIPDESKSNSSTTTIVGTPTDTAATTTTTSAVESAVYVITSPSAPVYSGPSADADTIGTLYQGDAVEILSDNVDTYLPIAYNGGVGYVLKTHIGVNGAPDVTLSGITETTAAGTTTGRSTTAPSTAPTHKTTATTAVKTTATTTNPYTAADLFFPLDSPSVTPPDGAATQEVSLLFGDLQRRVRMQLPDTLTVQLVGSGSKAYAAVYCGKLRVGRLLVNTIYPDVVSGVNVGEAVTLHGVDVQTLAYLAGGDEATTYYGYFIDTDNYFYTLEISADYVSQKDFAVALSSLQIMETLARSNRLDCRNQEGLRIAIAGNSFVGYSEIAEQLRRMLRANGKNASAEGFSYPNITVAQIAADKQIMQTLCGGDYDVLFIGTAYYNEDVIALSAVEEACNASGTELVLFPAHNEGEHNTQRAYRNTAVKLGNWKAVLDRLLAVGVPESDLIYYDNVRHSKPLAGYCGAVMIYGMLYESAPNTAALGASFCGVTEALAQQVEDVTMAYVRQYFE